MIIHKVNQSCKTHFNSNMMNLVILFKRQSREDKRHDIICLLSMFDTALFFSSILKFEDIKEVIRSRKSERQCIGQKKKDKWANDDLQTLHRKIKIEQHEPH
jgi:hypothetical protein